LVSLNRREDCMDNIIVGMFDDAHEADAVIEELEARGIPKDRITVESTDGGTTQADTLKERSFFQKVGDAITGRDKLTYREGVRRGGTVVSAHVDDVLVDDTVAVMEQHGAIDIDERSAEWRQEGWRTQMTDHDEPARGGGPAKAVTLPVVEEELQVGKRQVARGGVRVFSEVSERPVEEQVHLREEHVDVQRRPVDRRVPADDPDLFREGTFEVTERAEEAVVGKEARVVEEVVVGKTTSEHTETVRDTVRRTDVDVEEIDAGADRAYEEHYRSTYSATGRPYDDYAAAYRYGGQLAADERYRDRSWNDLEPRVRQAWEGRRGGTWDQFKDAIRYGWDRLRGHPPGRRHPVTG
jgi:uncharacterized protein (TIGR02271 family)